VDEEEEDRSAAAASVTTELTILHALYSEDELKRCRLGANQTGQAEASAARNENNPTRWKCSETMPKYMAREKGSKREKKKPSVLELAIVEMKQTKTNKQTKVFSGFPTVSY
jgi:hypothetical protein